MSWKMVMIQQMMMTLQMASTVALHILSQLDARHGHHPVQGLQQGASASDDHVDDDNVFLLHFSASKLLSQSLNQITYSHSSSKMR